MPNTVAPMRLLLWITVVGVAIMASLPHPPQLPIDDLGDKFEHAMAFGVLTILSALAYPAFPLPRLAERLSFFGAGIEVVQSIPALHRDCDILDWITDTIAILVTVLLVSRLRAWRNTRSVRA